MNLHISLGWLSWKKKQMYQTMFPPLFLEFPKNYIEFG